MASLHPDHELITSRQAGLVEAFNKADIKGMLSYYADEGLDFSDYGVGVLHLDKAGITSYYTGMLDTCANMVVTTKSISGHKYFTTWEWNLEFNFVKPLAEVEATGDKEFKEMPPDGRLVKMVGCSVAWWDEKGKVVKNHDYAKTVESFEGYTD